MSYATSTELEQRMGTALLVQLTDDAGTGVADPAKVAAVLEAAEAEIDSYLARRYQVPVDVAEEPRVAAILRTMTLDLAEHGLHVRRPPVPADVASRRTTTLDWLRRAAEGTVLLPAGGELPLNTSNGPAAFVTGSPRAWAREEAGEL